MINPRTTEDHIIDLLARAYSQRGDNLSGSITLSFEALTLSRSLKNSSLIGKCLSKLALYYMVSADNEKAISMAEEAITHFTVDNDELGIANAKYSIAGVYYKTNNYHLGMFHLIDCLTIFKKFKDKHNESKTYKSLGTIYEVLGDQPSAIKAYNNAIECAKYVEDLNLESNVYNPLSGIFIKQNNIEKALDIIEKSVAIKKATGDRRGSAFALYGRGKVFTKLEKYDAALRDFNAALVIHREVEDKFAIAMCYNKMAILFLQKNDRKQAKDILLKAIALSNEHDLSIMKYKCYKLMYRIYKEEDNAAQALYFLEKYIAQKDNSINSHTLRVIENYERISKVQSKENEARFERQKAEIARKQEQAEQNAKMKQNFLSAMSHEIRTPLNAVTSIISLLQERSDEGEKQLLTSLQFSAKNLLRIINDILDFSKLESNKMVIEKHPVAITSFLKNIKDTYASLAEEKRIHLHLNMDPEMSDAYMLDETKLFQILGNLISNAVKFTKKGSVTINVTLAESKTASDILQFKIIDTGKGISEKDRKSLFESFYIPQSITTRHDGGTGLGLAIVKKLIELHDSRITINSTLDEGSTFSFYLELEKTFVPIKSEMQVAQSLKGKVVILAEDNEINTLVMEKLLSKWGVQMIRTKNGLDAVEKAKEKEVDFILMDIHMPKMNGFDATTIIRTTENPNKNTPIFALTADVTAANSHEVAHYFSGFLWKPIEIEKLYNALSQTLVTA